MTLIIKMQKAQFDLMISLKAGQLRVKKQFNLLRSTILRELNGVREGKNALKPVECFRKQKLSELSFSRNVSGKDMLRGTRLGAAWRMLEDANGEMALSRSWNAPAATEPARSPSSCLCRSLGGCRQSASSVTARRISFLRAGGSMYRHSWSRSQWEQRRSGRGQRMKLGRAPAPDSFTCLSTVEKLEPPDISHVSENTFNQISEKIQK